MRRIPATSLVVLGTFLAATAGFAQPAATPTSYTFVAQWQIPRQQWANFESDFDKNTRPVLEKLAAAGTIDGWGAFENIVHTDDGPTHGTWWSATSVAGIEKARIELRKASAASASLASATKHHDFFLRSIVGGGKPGSGTDAYLRVSSFLVKQGQGSDWRQLFDKNQKPVFDDLVGKGVLMGYSVDVEDVHTDSQLWRHVVTVTPNIDADDKIGEAFDAITAKLTPEERKTRQLAAQAVIEAHRDSFARVIRYWSK
jgi:hypothetical protein